MDLGKHKINLDALNLSALHLPQDEYQSLERFMTYPNSLPIHTAVYSSGVIVILLTSDMFILRDSYPVLYDILRHCVEEEIKIVDFDENSAVKSDIKSYEHF